MGRGRACWEEGAPPAGSAQAIPCFQLQNSESREEVGDMNGLEVYISHGSYSDSDRAGVFLPSSVESRGAQ